MKRFFKPLINLQRHAVTLFLIAFIVLSCKDQPVITKENTMNESILEDYANYNLWANEQFVEWLSNATDEQLETEIESSFSTIRATIIHLWGAEYGWLTALKNEPWGRPFDGDTFDGSNKDLFDHFIKTSTAFKAFVNNIEASNFKNKPKTDAEYTNEEVVLTVFNHASYHRGQIITLGRQIGLTAPPRTDYIYYVREVRSKK